MIACPPAQQSMASSNPQGFHPPRPAMRTPSFPQASARDDHDSVKPPKRAQTFHSGSPTQRHREQGKLAPIDTAPDAFETAEPTDNDDAHDLTRASVDLDDLPIELITLTDSFIDSLGAKVHPTPPNIDRLSHLFQDFYALASSHVGTHISALASRQSRDASPSPSASTISSAASRLRSKAASFGAKEKSKTEAEQQMITAEELANRKRARKALEARRGLLEEAVERRLCEGIYGRIYRHRSTQDEAQDDMLRSKTAALALVGIGLADLGVEMGDGPSASDNATDRERDVREWLGQARDDLIRMSESRYPLGKLNNLKAVHKSIVNTLAYFHPSASADEIMPMLIYTLITMPPEKLHIMSDLHFIQQFRWETKLTGEAAYCLTNLEAAISFLQTVDLATLREDEHPSGQLKSATKPGTPKVETFPPAYPQGPQDIKTPTKDAGETNTVGTSPTKSAPPSAARTPNMLKSRRLSELVNTPAQAFGAASGAVFSTADQGLKTISSSLGDSYSFLLGKLRDGQQSTKSSSIVVPRTLDDARKLVSTPPPDEDDGASGASSTAGAEDAEKTKPSPVRDDRVVNMIARRREPSVESVRSGRSAGSNKKVLFAEESKSSASFLSSGQTPAVLDQVRNLGSSFNPMARLSNMGMIRGFGRNTPTPTSTAAASPKDIGKTSDGGDLASAFPDIADALPPKEGPKVAPPNKRFMEVQNPGELRLSEVQDLLGEYRRMAEALKSLGAFEDS